MWRAALLVGIAPSDFWRLSVREWRWLSSSQPTSLSGVQLQSLMQEHPDG
ncbi:MAG: phage tail assembly chaperone [Pseudomonadota bacterium]